MALSDVKTWLPEVGLRSTNSFHTAPQTDTLPFLRSTDAYIYLTHCSGVVLAVNFETGGEGEGTEDSSM